MAHIHKLIDFVVTAYIVNKNRVLLVHHKLLDQWLPVGGHIELHEDSDQALMRKIKEESGLNKRDLLFIGNKPKIKSKDTNFLLAPQYTNLHHFHPKPGHKHLGLIYFVKSKTEKVVLKKSDHKAIRWFTRKELAKNNLDKAVKFYATQALKIMGSR